MKKIISYVLMSVFAVAAVTLTSCKKDETTGEARLLNLYLTPVQSLVEIGDTAEVVVYASYSNGSNVDVTAEAKIEVVSGNCVTVKEGTGKVIGVSVGESVLSATFEGMTDRASVISSEVDHLAVVANYETNKALMVPLDTLVKGEGIIVEAVLKSITEGGETYKKALDADDYEIAAAGNVAVEKSGDKEVVVAKESGIGAISAIYKGKVGTAAVSIAENKGFDFRLDVDITSKGADVVMLGSVANVIATADYVWSGVKCKKKGDESKDTAATIDISGKLIVHANTPSVLGVSGTSVSALQIADDEIYSIFRMSESKDTTLTRKVCVLKEDDLKCEKYTIELPDSAFYDEIQYKYYANYFRVNGSDTTRFQVDLTNTENKKIIVYYASCDAIFDSGFIGKSTGKIERKYMHESIVYGYADKKDHRLQLAVVYNEEDTVFSKPFDIYDKIEYSYEYGADSVFFRVNSISPYFGNPICFHNDYKVADDLGHDLTGKVTYKEFSFIDEDGVKRVAWRAALPYIYVTGRKITVFYGPGDKSVEWDFSEE